MSFWLIIVAIVLLWIGSVFGASCERLRASRKERARDRIELMQWCQEQRQNYSDARRTEFWDLPSRNEVIQEAPRNVLTFKKRDQ